MSPSNRGSRVHDTGSLLSSSPLGKTGSADGTEYPDENETGVQGGFFGQETPAGKTSKAQEECGSDQDDSSLITPPDSGSTSQAHSQSLVNDARTLSSPFTLSFEPQGFNAASIFQAPASEWETRARSASPAAALARHVAMGREKKKAQFIDRLRRRRDDIRSAGYGEQVLRMDFVRERRLWEDEMRRRAALVDAQVGEEDEDAAMLAMAEEEQDEHHPSPTEGFVPDVDIDELVRSYEAETRQPRALGSSSDDEFPFDDPDDDDEYERLFREMEIVSQSQRQNQHQSGPPQEQNHQLEDPPPRAGRQPSAGPAAAAEAAAAAALSSGYEHSQPEAFDENMDLS